MSTEPTTQEKELETRFVLKNYEKGGPHESADVVFVAQAMSDAPTDEIRYKLAKIMLDRTKTNFIDPMKEIREKEKKEEQKAAEEKAAKGAEFRDRLNAIISQDVLEEIATIGADYGEAGLGRLLSIEIVAKPVEGSETNEWKAEFTSNVTKVRASRAGGTRTRESGPTGAGVLVSGKAEKEGEKGKNLAGEYPELAEPTKFDSFAEAARHLGYVDDNTEMKGLNCKRLLISKGFEVDYVKGEEKPAEEATPAA